MYNGYEETLERATDRLNARQLRHIEETYGKDWEQDATDVRMHLESLDICDWLHEALAADADDEDNRRTMHEAAM
jgi:hypothetical protein